MPEDFFSLNDSLHCDWTKREHEIRKRDGDIPLTIIADPKKTDTYRKWRLSLFKPFAQYGIPKDIKDAYIILAEVRKSHGHIPATLPIRRCITRMMEHLIGPHLQESALQTKCPPIPDRRAYALQVWATRKDKLTPGNERVTRTWSTVDGALRTAYPHIYNDLPGIWD